MVQLCGTCLFDSRVLIEENEQPHCKLTDEDWQLTVVMKADVYVVHSYVSRDSVSHTNLHLYSQTTRRKSIYGMWVEKVSNKLMTQAMMIDFKLSAIQDTFN